jgi:hypothetical protein
MTLAAYDFSRGDTEEKQYKNLLAASGDGNIKGMFYGSATVDVASLVDGAGATASITVTGVALGDIVMGASFAVDLVDMTVTGYVSAADTVEVRIQNESGATVDLASTTVRVIVADMT